MSEIPGSELQGTTRQSEWQNSDLQNIDRRTALQMLGGGVAAGALFQLAPLYAGEALPAAAEGSATAMLPNDSRLGALKDLNGYFPFTPSATPEAWEARAAEVRRQILVACGLWPMPSRPPLKAIVHGLVDRDDFTVERVILESSPGLYCTGSLFRPKGFEGPRPAILCPHGHWANGRFYDHGAEVLKQQLDKGGEKSAVTGRFPLQSRCVQLARMGCVVFHYDMLGVADSAPINDMAHRFNTQRPDMSAPEHWGLYSAQAELRLLNPFGLQTWNSIRALDFVLGLPGIDAKRIGCTGASGGGTQTFILTAIDQRVAAEFPAVMVSTAMQGGCTCENATYLRVNTGNIEFAALASPRPIGMTGANDWTREIETKGLPELKQHYTMLGIPDRVEAKYYDFEHNYNVVSRTMMYEFFNKHFNLGATGPIQEKDFQPLTKDELTVWNAEHPKPAMDVDHEIAFLKALEADSNKQIQALTPKNAETLAEYRRVVGGALAVMIGRGLPQPGAVEVQYTGATDKGTHSEVATRIRYHANGEELPAVALIPRQPGDRLVIWIDAAGKAGLYENGKPKAAVQHLLDAGVNVVGVDLLYQGEFLADGKPLTETRRVNNNREFVGFTLGYNHPLFSQRVQDILSTIAAVQVNSKASIELAGFGEAGPLVIAAAAIAGKAVSKVAVGTSGFRFATLTNIRDPRLLPGAVKYGDVPGMLSLCAPTPLWLADEAALPEIVTATYAAAGSPEAAALYSGPANDAALAAAKWL